MNKFRDMLSTRSRNGIARCFCRDEMDHPEKIAAAGSARLRMTLQLRPKSIKEIAGALHKLGFIGNADN
jgi:hypothetical protein